jgi:hypothetical protein
MRRINQRPLHPPGILERLVDRIRGREQLLARGGETMPLLLLSYPRGQDEAAREVEAAYTHTLRRLREEIVAPYVPVFAALPTMIVILLRARNVCGCLGHNHPRGAHSRLARRLSADLGSPVGEMDLAYEGIREWRPQPLSSMAVGELGGRLEEFHVQAATLAVLLHEMEHMAFSEHGEQEIRARSNALYAEAMEQFVAEETDSGYGMAAPSPRP